MFLNYILYTIANSMVIKIMLLVFSVIKPNRINKYEGKTKHNELTEAVTILLTND